MVKKISLSVDVPFLGQKLDFLIPENMVIDKVVSLITRIILEENQGINCNQRELMLIDLKSSKVLNKTYSLEQFGINNGSRLMLF